MSDLLKSILLGIVEGITEFLPISSTGHLLLCQRWMGINLETDPFWKLFTIVIQFGAILSVLIYFRDRIVTLIANGLSRGKRSRRPFWMIVVGTLPVLVVGFILKDWIDDNMDKPRIIIASLAIGGVFMILAEYFPHRGSTDRLEDISYPQAIFVGFCQILAAIFPGTSRSAATIIGGRFAGLSRPAAAEFSFFLAIPAMAAASGYKLLKADHDLLRAHYLTLLVGSVVSFLVAWASIAWLMRFIRTHSFTPFALYRLLLAALAAWLLW